MCDGTTLDSRYVIAKKWHRCVWCWFTPIEVGEVHLRYAVAADGSVQTGRMHLWCSIAADAAMDEGWCEWVPGNEPPPPNPFRRAHAWPLAAA